MNPTLPWYAEPNWYLVALTLGVIGVAAWQAGLTWYTLRTNRRTERAYVVMTHTPKDLVIDSILPGHSASLAVEVKNFGNTPARITDIALHHALLSTLPSVPPYDQREEPEQAFLVKNDALSVGYAFEISHEALEQVRRREVGLWVLGYVDYIDVFGDRHRAGYARRARAETREDLGNGLTKYELVFERTPGYNYDRPRTRGEGRD